MSFIKDPAASLDYTFDWTAWLAVGETISAQAVTATDGITVAPTGKPTAVDAGRVIVWLEGGTAGSNHTVTCRITTSAGRVDERTMRVHVMDR